jgi:hypothetical protein
MPTPETVKNGTSKYLNQDTNDSKKLLYNPAVHGRLRSITSYSSV